MNLFYLNLVLEGVKGIITFGIIGEKNYFFASTFMLKITFWVDALYPIHSIHIPIILEGPPGI